ncbi:MAG: hypothetical protein U0841_12500 [Chloroflexia bacterium]
MGMVMQGEVVIARLAADEVGEYLSELVGALREAVEDGASVGFLPPLGVDEARGYWEGVIGALREGSRVLLGRGGRMGRCWGRCSWIWRCGRMGGTGRRCRG